MITSPHYSSHAEQQAMLGCAANLDPDKFPRRYAQFLARKRMPVEARDPVIGRPRKRDEIQEKQRSARDILIERAKDCSHMTLKDAAAHLGITCDKLRKLRRKTTLEFAAAPPRHQATLDQIELLAAKGLKIREIAEQINRAKNYVGRVIREHGFKRGPKMNLEA